MSLTLESVPSFAEVVLIETRDDAVFFANEVDEAGVCYAGQIQAWLELNSGEARQREIARDLFQSIVNQCRVRS